MGKQKQQNSITDDFLRAKGFVKAVKDNGLIQYSKSIPGTDSDFIVMETENGLFYAPQISTPGVILNEMLTENKHNESLLHSMEEVNSYYQVALKRFQNR